MKLLSLMRVPSARVKSFCPEMCSAPRLAISLSQILAMVKANVWHAIAALWTATMHAIVAWALVAPLAVYLIYKILSPILKRLALVSGLAKPEANAASVAEVY